VKALVWYGETDLRYEEVAEPEPAPDEVLVEVALAGICGSDLHGYRGHPGPRVPPLVLGHEVVGFAEGKLVTVYPLVCCGACARCRAGEDNLCADWRLLGIHRPGVFADKVAVPRRCLVALPPQLELRRAVLAEPLACCVGALAPQPPKPGSAVTVLGAGPIGLLTVSLAAAAGATVTAVDPVEARLDQARRLGAAETCASVEELEPDSAELVVDAAGFAATWRAALATVRTGGSVVVLGLGQAEAPFPMALLVRRSIRLRGQFAYSRADFAHAVELLERGELELGWLAQARLADAAQAFASLVEHPELTQKVLLEP
jgi:threonine dehydrogenase-like Zn-dependent dehydrogenase